MKRKHLYVVVLGILLSIMFSANAVPAAEDVPEITVEKVEVVAYDQVILDKHDTEYDIIETLQIEDTIFLRVDMYMSPKWTETAKKANIKAKEIVLVSEDDVTIEMAGYFKYSIFYRSSNSLYISRPYDWDKAEQPPFRYNAVFLVPKDSKAFTFKLGADISANVEVPAVQPLPDPKDNIKVKVLGTKFSDTLPREVHVGGDRRKTTIAPAHAKFLEVKINVTATAPSNPDQKSFYLSVPWFGLVYDNGHYAAAIGAKQSTGDLSRTRSQTIRQKEGKWETEEIVICFTVPEDINTFTLTYLLSPVAEGSVGGVAKVEEAAPEKPTEARVPVEETAQPSGEELVKQVQSLLTGLGYEPGPVDGKMGTKTAEAIKAFQKEAGLAQDGKPSVELLDALKSKI